MVTGSSVTFAPQPAMNTAPSAPPMRLRKFALNSDYPAAVQAHDHNIRVNLWRGVPLNDAASGPSTVVRCEGMCNTVTGFTVAAFAGIR